jgi:ubiquinone/menaquinone biosynthesis C-methylase UbiE
MASITQDTASAAKKSARPFDKRPGAARGRSAAVPSGNGAALGTDEEEKARRVRFFREWFESWLEKPLSMRSTGQYALPQEYFISMAEFVARTLRLDPESDAVLDVGCDSAMVSRLVAPRCRRFVGVDFMPGLLAQTPGKENILSASGAPASFIAADGRALPFRPRAFNKAYCEGVIHTLPSVDDGVKLIEDMTRVCGPGATLLVGGVPDVAKRTVARLEVLRRGAWSDRIKLILSFTVPGRIKNFFRRRGFKLTRMVLLEYDFAQLKERFEAQGFRCEIVHFPDRFWSRDFRRTRTNLLIRIPAPAQGPGETPDLKFHGLASRL